MSFFQQPWPWYVAGPLIGLTVPALLLLVGKPFGISSSFRHLGSICSPGTRIAYLRENNWRDEIWNLFFVAGIMIGAFLAGNYLVKEPVALLPQSFSDWQGGLLLFFGGCLVGFGARWAGGCTSGHSIMGISGLNWSSLLATCCFFAGGLLMTWVIRPFLFAPINS